jgi:hypothetical protein
MRFSGYSAWRSKDLGSCFVRSLVYVFANYAHEDHVIDMMTKVLSMVFLDQLQHTQSALGIALCDTLACLCVMLMVSSRTATRLKVGLTPQKTCSFCYP